MILLNGQIRDETVPLSIHSNHFQYGTGFFETLLYRKGKLFFYEEHMSRIEKTCQHFSIALDRTHLSHDAILSLIDTLPSPAENLRVKIIYAPLSSPARDKWDTAVYALNYQRRSTPLKVSVHREAYNSSFHRYKSMNYDYNRHWRSYYTEKNGSDEVLFCIDQKRIIEGSYTNIILRKGNIVYYAGKDLPCLPGIAQAKVLDFALSEGFELQESSRGFSLFQIKKAHEVIATNSLLIGENISHISMGNEWYTLKADSTLRNRILNNFLK